MKSTALIAGASLTLAGCVLNGGTPITAWGKKDVSMVDYRTDAGQCTVIAVTTRSNDNAAKTAGGIYGSNSGIPDSPGASGSATAVAASAGGGLPLISGSLYRDSAPADFVNRAAMQQRTQELSTQVARYHALKSCLYNRGYREFALSAAQRAELERLPPGSEARRNYLYKLGTDPRVLEEQSISRDQRGS
jgi:hypothetical protein